ncbi:MAG TPA: hypothetical protein VEL70_06245, partial [Candidatus Acidoferrum sp.]|nr:hypothetical protein [Candidatus Acidoferrum sp.]
SKVYSKLKDEKHVLYNYVVNILLDRIMTKGYIDKTQPIKLIAAKRETNKFLNDNFKTYLEKQVKDNHKVSLSVEIKVPSEEKSLQLVDFVSWSVFRKYEREDEAYYLVIKHLIKEESGLFS